MKASLRALLSDLGEARFVARKAMMTKVFTAGFAAPEIVNGGEFPPPFPPALSSSLSHSPSLYPPLSP